MKWNFFLLELLRSPSFHRMVRSIHKSVHELRHGPDPSSLGGTKIDQPKIDPRKFVRYFMEELKEQVRGGGGKR